MSKETTNGHLATPQEYLIHLITEVNQDSATINFLKKYDSKKLLDSIDNHASILALATERQFTKTFDILINYGFDPLKKPKDQVNPFALACKTQGEGPLEAYLQSIKKKASDVAVRAELASINEQNTHLREVDKIQIRKSNLKPIGEEAGKKAVEKVLRADGGALKHVVEGRGYVDVAILLEKYGVNLSIDTIDNAKIAAQKNYAGILDKLLNNASDELIEMVDDPQPSATTSASGDLTFVIDSVLLANLKNKKSPFAQKLQKRIEEKKSSLTEKDLFKICESNGIVALNHFVSHMASAHKYDLKKHTNDENMEDGAKRPLYYAIDNKAYNSLVKALLNEGADPDVIAPGLDAATLAVRKKESGTLKLLLKSEKLSSTSIESAYQEMQKGGDNTMLQREFLEGLSKDSLADLNAETQLGLFEIAFAKPELETYLKKFRTEVRSDFCAKLSNNDLHKLTPEKQADALGLVLDEPQFQNYLRKFNNVKPAVIDKLLTSIIEKSDSAKLEKLFSCVEVKSIISITAAVTVNPLAATEKTALLNKKSPEEKIVDSKYMRNALQKSGSEEGKSVLKILRDQGFETDEIREQVNQAIPSNFCETIFKAVSKLCGFSSVERVS